MTKTAVNRPVTTVMCVLIVFLAGIFAYSSLELAYMPSVDLPVALVSTTYSGTGPEEMEDLVTKPIEQTMATLTGVDTITSQSSTGSSMVAVQFVDGTDIDSAVNDMRDKLDRVKHQLPDDADDPSIMKMDINAQTIEVGVTSDKLNPTTLYELLDNNVTSQICKKIEGVASADMKGGDAAMILALKWMLETKKRPKKSIYFCFTEDEESKGSGICGIVKDGTVNKVDEIIICEPSDEKIGTCEKGAFWLKITVQGKQSHASRPDLGINAVEYVEKLVAELKEQVETGEVHPILGTTTASVTKLCGGIMTNIIPPTAEAELDIRTVPGVSHEHILKCTEEIADRFRKEIPGIQLPLK